ncbi:gamma-glutamyltransferase family protein [Comamonas testosteroni]|uniref:Gamma-glutamyltransferase ywrD n=1 Tax=Comamonas testosteroni TaxID=285 RepID=A0A8B4RYI6_COMTE|nr:gamma-glutamyltransferase family protein [Comamonas testosteroni]EHN67746.1 gamma-glutamyltranspeptidase [Comamonas testosteroni ATCC 11996]QQN71157.1 gamma-glutamyltransferase family protein [Comamonas testosteroni]SUY74453.1 Putative gamma-glutamyltransferase ywrD [Comamonas testosteroni]
MTNLVKDWTLPYASHRSPVLGRNVVSTSQPLAAQAGLSMLLAGGNAVDAALAAAMTLTVVEPTGCGIGSDGFAIVWDGKELHGLNASGRSPAGWTPDYFAQLGGIPEKGWNAVTVPGAVSAWVALSKRFGKLPFAQVARPAIDYARSGFAVSPTIATLWELGGKKLGDQPGFAECFLPSGRAPRAGEVFRSEAHARTLEEIAQTLGESFYRGALARKMAEHSRACGGVMSEQDLAAHQADWVGTVSQKFGDSVIHEIPPNGQGIAALMALGMLDELGAGGAPIGSQPLDGVDSVHLQIEAMKLAFADLHQYNADLDHMRVTPAQLLDRDYLRERAQLIDREQASAPTYGAPRPGGTVYLAAADASGMMVSFIQSNYMGFGSGVVVPGTGISLQNRGHGFTTEAGHANQVGPRKRPSHTIIPAFAMHADGTPQMAFGVMGGPMQSQGHLQMALRVLRYGQNPQAAADAPRWRVTGGKGVAVEPSFDAAVVEQLRARGHEVSVEAGHGVFAFGGAQLVLRDGEHYIAGSDPRKDGCAVGY